jgi:hypothetical protein
MPCTTTSAPSILYHPRNKRKKTLSRKDIGYWKITLKNSHFLRFQNLFAKNNRFLKKKIETTTGNQAPGHNPKDFWYMGHL